MDADLPRRQRFPFPGLLQFRIQRRVVRLPDTVSRRKPRKIDLITLEKQPALFDLVDPTTLLVFGVPSGVEDDPVAFLHLGFPFELDPVFSDLGNFPGKGSALLPESGMHEFLVIDALKPTGRKSAGESHFQFVAVLLRRDLVGSCLGPIDRLSISASHRRNILRGLETSLDLETHDAEPDQLGDLVDPSEILGREEILLVSEVKVLAIDHEFVRHPAGLGTFAPVGTALTERLAGETLPGVGDTESPVDKGLQLDCIGLLGMKEMDLPHRVLAGNHGAVQIEEPVGECQRFGRGDRHLRRGVHIEIGNHHPRHRREAQVLDDDRVDPGLAQSVQLIRGGLQFAGEDQGVEGDESPHPMLVEKGHQVREIRGREIVGPDPGVELRHPEIDRVGTVGDRGPRALPIARRGQQFCLRSCHRPSLSQTTPFSS